MDYYLEQDQLLSTISKTFNTPINELPKRIEALQNVSKETAVTHLEKSIIDSHIQMHGNGYQSMGYYSETPIDGLRDEASRIAAMINGAVCLLSKQDNGQAQLAIAVSKTCVNVINAKTLVAELAPVIGGRGGGKDHLAMGAGPDIAAIPELLTAFQKFIEAL